MEPVAALGVAAAVVQFVDFSSRLVSKGHELYHSATGELAENAEMEKASKRLQELVEPLQSSSGDAAIATICQACVSVSKELIDCLTKLKVPTGNGPRRWKSFRQAFKSVWSKEKIKEMKRRLEDLRKELDTHVSLNIRDKVTLLSMQQDNRFKSLDSAAQSIMVALLDLRRAVREDLGNHFQHLIRSNHLEHDKTRAAYTSHIRAQVERRVCNTILESLNFARRTVRHETIAEAHKLTFEWIFRDPVAEQKPWSDFGHWLKIGSGIYWISGKAGSGKSTLMKFIVDHERTKEMLAVWAGTSSLETASYFFWKSGNPDQRSQDGLLRSLLYDILKVHNELVPIVFPVVWNRQLELALENVPSVLNSWTLTRLKEAFTLLVSAANIPPICLFIDGLDEYDGDYEELAAYFSHLACSTQVKICLSSRPWPAFQNAFRAFAGLRLQDLTAVDICRYVNDTMDGNVSMARLKNEEPERAENLVSELISKSSGVFLWVSLVVKSLLKGLSYNNSLETLRERLNAVPPDLDDLYGHMLASIDPTEMEEGSKIFLLYSTLGYLSDMELIYYGLTGTLQQALKPIPRCELQPGKVLQDHFASVFQRMEILLQTRCGGFLEIVDFDLSNWGNGARLDFIHRTAFDYLGRRDIWSALRNHIRCSKWNARRALLISAVICLKTSVNVKLDFWQSSSQVFRFWGNMVDQKQLFISAEHSSSDEDILLIDEFDAYATHFALASRWFHDGDSTIFMHWSNYINDGQFLPREDILSVAIEHGLYNYVRCKIERDPSLLHQRRKTPLLAHAVLGIQLSIYSRDIDVLELLLSSSADPNERFGGVTPWQCWLTLLHIDYSVIFDYPYYEDIDKKLWLRGTIAMMQAGANLDVCCIDGPTFDEHVFHKHQKLLESIRRFSLPEWRSSYKETIFEHNKGFPKNVECDHGKSSIERNEPSSESRPPNKEAHCFRAVIESRFRECDPESADELLRLFEKLKLEKAASCSDTHMVERKRNRKGTPDSKT